MDKKETAGVMKRIVIILQKCKNGWKEITEIDYDGPDRGNMNSRMLVTASVKPSSEEFPGPGPLERRLFFYQVGQAPERVGAS